MVGKGERDEFASVYETLRAFHSISVRNCHVAEHLAELDLLLILRSYPSEFSSQQFRQWRHRFPLLPIIVIDGSLCEGVLRTAPTIPGVFYVYANQWGHREHQILSQLFSSQPSAWSMPPTAGNDELTLVQPDFFDDPFFQTGDVFGIATSSSHIGTDRAMNELLADSLKKFGKTVVYLSLDDNCRQKTPIIPKPSIPGVQKILCDADDASFDQIFEAIERIHTNYADSDIGIFVHSPRIDKIRKFGGLSRLRVFGKPLL